MPEINPLTERLRQQLQLIENQMIELLDASTIDEFRNDPDSMVVWVRPSYFWGNTNEDQKRLQLQLLKSYSIWLEHFEHLFLCASQEIKKQVKNTDNFVINWIEKKSDWSIPATIQEAKLAFKEKIQVFYQLLQLLDTSNQAEIVLVPDTNSLIMAPDVSQYSTVVGQAKYTIVIVPTVLDELDKLKRDHRDKDFREKVVSVIRRLKGLREQGSLLKGVTVHKSVTVKMLAQEPSFIKTLSWLDPINNDDRIIATVLEIQREHPSAAVILVTSDLNLQNKAEMANLPFREPPKEEPQTTSTKRI